MRAARLITTFTFANNRTPRQWQNLPTQDELDELAALEEAMAM